MASAANQLRAVFEGAKVARVAIVDDGYDDPLITDVLEANWLAFHAAIDEAEITPARLEALGIEEDLPSFGDLRPPLLSQLWGRHVELVQAGADPATDTAARHLQTVFESFSGRKLAKLNELRAVEAIAEEATGSPADRLPSSARAAELASYDLVFLDFYLGEETRNGAEAPDLEEQAKQRARSIVRETLKAAGSNPTPLFVLISSRATQESAIVFRDEAEILASKFRFLTKKEFDLDRVKAEYMLASLVGERNAGDAVERLLREWQASIQAATSELMTSVRRLEVVDYAYLRQYRLAEERVSLLEYLTWLFNAYLGSFVERHLAKSDANLIAPLRDAPVPAAQIQPMSEIPRIYSEVTTTQVREYADGENAKVMTGDLFVSLERLRRANAKDRTEAARTQPPHDAADAPPAIGEGAAEAPEAQPPKKGEAAAAVPDILAVISPVCDLIPGREKTDAILLLGGTLSVPGSTKAPSSHMVVVDRPGRPKGVEAPRFQVDWHPKWPVTHARKSFDGQGILGTDYVRVGRLRELYAVEVAQMLGGEIGRAGPPVAPPFSHPLAVRVLAKRAGKVFRLLDCTVDEAEAWELFATKDGEKRAAVLTETVLWRIRTAALSQIADEKDPCRLLLADPAALRPMAVAFPMPGGKATVAGTGDRLLVKKLGVLPPKDTISEGNALAVVMLAPSPEA